MNDAYTVFATERMHCACIFRRPKDFTPAELVEACAFHEAKDAYAVELEDVVNGIAQYDGNSSGDGDLYRYIVSDYAERARAVLAKNPNPSGLAAAATSTPGDGNNEGAGLTFPAPSGPVGLGPYDCGECDGPKACAQAGTCLAPPLEKDACVEQLRAALQLVDDYYTLKPIHMNLANVMSEVRAALADKDAPKKEI